MILKHSPTFRAVRRMSRREPSATPLIKYLTTGTQGTGYVTCQGTQPSPGAYSVNLPIYRYQLSPDRTKAAGMNAVRVTLTEASDGPLPDRASGRRGGRPGSGAPRCGPGSR